jgi:competence protein ComEA
MSVRTLALSLLCFSLGAGVALFLFQSCGQAGQVTVRFDGQSDPSGVIRVYVYGAVRAPGVYPLHSGDRVVDAVEAAGGPSEDADTEAINFAQRLHDEDEVHVPRVGEATDPSGTPTAAATGAARININRADVALLSKLPGVGPTRASRIVDSRNQDGPFTSTDQLVQRKLLPPAIYAQVKDQISAGP